MNSTNPFSAAITAIGGFVPPTILSNAELETRLDTSDEWIRNRTGIKERRIVKEENFATSDLAANAIKDLLNSYNIPPQSIDLLVLATSTPDKILAPSASAVCTKAGLYNAWGFDLNAACSGFVFALSVGASFIENGRHKNVLVVGADTMSAILDYEDRTTCVLFGDGAGAVLLQAVTDGSGIKKNISHVEDGSEYLSVPAGGSLEKASKQTVTDRKHFVRQDGKTVFKNAIKRMTQACNDLLSSSQLNKDAVDWVIPHQANLRIIQSVSSELGIPIDKFKINIEKYGNTTAATIPLCLWDFQKDFKRGDNLLITAFGAGFTWGASHIIWSI